MVEHTFHLTFEFQNVGARNAILMMFMNMKDKKRLLEAKRAVGGHTICFNKALHCLNELALKLDRAGQKQRLFCIGNEGLSSDIFPLRS